MADMPREFKLGDKVVPKEGKPLPSKYRRDFYTINKIIKSDQVYLHFEEINGGWWSHRFELKEEVPPKEKFKAGTTWKHPGFNGHYRIIEAREEDAVVEAYPDKTNDYTGTSVFKWARNSPEWSKLIEYKVPEAGAVYVNIYPKPFRPITYRTREEADENAGPNRLACVEVQWTEGEGL